MGVGLAAAAMMAGKIAGYSGARRSSRFIPSFQSTPMFRTDPQGNYVQGSVGWDATQTDKLYGNAVRQNLARTPGWDAATVERMYTLPAEQTKAEETSALRRMNQGAAGSGRYGSGGLVAGRGQVLGEGMRTRADIKRQVLNAAAERALQDRYDQIRLAGEYTDPRLQMGLQEGLARNSFALGRGSLEMQRWLELNRLRSETYDMGGRMFGNFGSAMGAAGGGK
jgi:hypothetical protein